MTEKNFKNVIVDEPTYAGLKRLKYNTGGRSYTSLIQEMISIAEARITEETKQEALKINNTRK